MSLNRNNISIRRNAVVLAYIENMNAEANQLIFIKNSIKNDEVFYKNDKPLYGYSYNTTITNESTIALRFISVKWNVFELNKNYEIFSSSLRGQKPLILPLESFSYKSNLAIESEFGAIEAYFLFQDVISKDFIEIKSVLIQLHPEYYMN
ncbi:MAG: hypothetical protein CMC19_06530 [Flavobacteriaceae bacterium]|nr:hypothetical protein [Flavobacteriaceae bacterium]OUX39772.1 MAG: hypothetical protein CBE25_03050 [Flavobacteriaceae bacterium TMED265]